MGCRALGHRPDRDKPFRLWHNLESGPQTSRMPADHAQRQGELHVAFDMIGIEIDRTARKFMRTFD